MPRIEVLDTTIIAHAHEFVTSWRRNPKRGPFTDALRDAEHALLDPVLASDLHRKAFRQIANAIRVGYGHIETNPRPLVDILRRTVGQMPIARH